MGEDIININIKLIRKKVNPYYEYKIAKNLSWEDILIIGLKEISKEESN